MARKARVWFPGAIYHITKRGNRRSSIFYDDKDRLTYLHMFKETCSEFPCILHSYCLMPNHIHLQLETIDHHPKYMMQRLNARYAIYFNRRHSLDGHLFQGRYWSELILSVDYFLKVSKYIHLNPVEANLVSSPEQYRWSSCSAYFSSTANPYIDKSRTLSHFPDPSEKYYRHFIEQKKDTFRGSDPKRIDIIYDFTYDKNMMKKENKQQRAYRIIKSRIVEKEYVPGQRIVIDQLARELQTSSIPIREAIRQLEAEGLIEYKHNIGPVVAPINESEYYENLKVLAVLEGYAVASCSQNFPAAKIMKLKEKNKQMKEALEDFDIIAFAKLNAEFHHLIYEENTNRVLVEHIENIWKRLDSIRGIGSTLYSVRVKESIKEHEKIISLLEKKSDAKTVEEIVRMHKLRTAEDFERRRSMRMENTLES